MNYKAYAQLFREKVVGQNDSTAVPSTVITLYTNVAKDRLAREIVTGASNGADSFAINQTTNLVEGQREYSFPTDVLKNIKVVQAFMGDKWRRVFPFDLSSYRLRGGTTKPYWGNNPTESFSGATTDESTVAEQFTNENPQFDVDGKSLVLYSNSVDAVDAGLKLKALIYPKDYVDGDWSREDDMSIRDSSTSTAMPRQSHDILLTKAVIDYKEVKGIPLTAFEAGYYDEERKMINSLSDINDDEAITAEVPLETGYDF